MSISEGPQGTHILPLRSPQRIPGPVWACCVEPEQSVLLGLSDMLCPLCTPEVSPGIVPIDREWCLSLYVTTWQAGGAHTRKHNGPYH